MAKGIYKRTEEYKLKLSETIKKLYAQGMIHGMSGKHHTEISKHKQSETRLKRKNELGYLNSPETRQKLRIANSGVNNPMFGVHKFGKGAPNYGKHHSEETKKKIREARQGSLLSNETKKKISEKLKGKTKSEEHKKNLSLSHKGKIVWNKGKECPQFSGANNPRWQGGKSFEPYTPEFNKEFKYLIRFRDNFSCVNCGISEQKHIILYRKKLPVHHIDYDKENTCLQNCCTLCVKCHTLTNLKNRREWTEYYQEKLSKLYNYKYEKEMVILNMGK